MSRLLQRTALATLLALAVAACGDDDDAATPTSGQSPTEADGGDTGGPLEFTAVDIDFEEAEATAQAGDIEVTLVNEGAIEHSWVVDGHEDALRLHTQQSGATDEGTITLEAGEYTYYCDIPGHRDAGMEGTLTVE